MFTNENEKQNMSCLGNLCGNQGIEEGRRENIIRKKNLRIKRR